MHNVDHVIATFISCPACLSKPVEIKHSAFLEPEKCEQKSRPTQCGKAHSGPTFRNATAKHLYCNGTMTILIDAITNEKPYTK